MKLTDMERRLLDTVTRIEAEAADREERLTAQLNALTQHVDGLRKCVTDLLGAYSTLAAKWNEE